MPARLRRDSNKKVLRTLLIIRFLIVTIVIFLVAFQGQALAAPAARGQAQIFNDNLGVGPGTGFDVTRLVNLLKGFACWSIRFAIVTVSVMLVFYGILFLKSRGSPEGMTNAKKSLTWGLVGGVVIFGVFTIILSVAALLGVDYPTLSC